MRDDLVRPPAFISRAALARELDMAESTVDQMVVRGILPPPIRLSTGCVRWDWEDVVSRLRARKDGAVTQIDPYLAGARHATQGAERDRGAA